MICFVLLLSVSYLKKFPFFFFGQAQIQIVSHLETKKNKADEIGKIYDTWIGKIGKQHKEVSFFI